jgi:signal transduction histidine kinase
MKVTPALKKQLAQWLDTYWTTYLKGDIDTWATFIREDYRNIGGTKEEIWNSKQEILDYTNSILDQMLGAAEIRNREIEVIPYGEYMMVNEFTDLFVKAEGEWTLYGPFRMSSLLEKTDTGWIALHQHGSYPDMKAMEGEAFSMDAVKAENAKLMEMVKIRTAELEIEAALERVRAVAMGMKKPEDMLDVCRIISDQLHQFGVEKIRNVQTAIIDENRGQYLCYQYFKPYDKTVIEKTEYLKSPVEQEMVSQMLVSRDGHFIGSLLGEELEAFRSHRIEENHFHDPLLDKASEVSYCFLSIGEGGLGLSLYQAMDEQVLIFFKRFHQVFSLAYQRFRDIQKAEEQAREAQIEAALERVRSRSMAMHKSEEFPQVIQVVFEQFILLDFKTDSAQFDVSFRETDDLNLWAAAPGQPYPTKLHIPYADKEIFNSIKKAKKAGHEFVSIQLTKEEKNDFFNYFFVHVPSIPEERKKLILSSSGMVRSAVLLEKVSLAIQNYSGIPYSDAEHNILKRFAKGFEQTYVRFLDLQKAEAQAREAQIEAALEKVRSRTMAMQHSDKLRTVVLTMYEELNKLNFNAQACNIILADKTTGDREFWVSGFTHDMYPESYKVPYIDHPYVNDQLNAWKQGEQYNVIEYSGQLKKDFDKIFFTETDFKNVPADAKRMMIEAPSVTFSTAFFSHGSIQALGSSQLSMENADILKRFAKVFEQTYTRFLDLQKAEAQAKEAQIEASLERVRSKTMAMHNSLEVGESVATLFEELSTLSLLDVNDRCGVGIMQPNEIMEAWTAAKTPDGKAELTIGHINMKLHPMMVSAYGGWLEKKEINQYILEGEDILSYYDAIRNQSDYKIKRDYFSDQLRIVHTDFYFNEGCLYVFSQNEFSANSIAVFLRFVGVFGQTYRRYLDLQKAEAQAMEAQIEAALEKVRSRSMAMHNSQELKEVALELRKQMGKIGQKDLEVCAIHLYGDDEDFFESWSAMKVPDSEVEIVQAQTHFPKNGIRIVDEMMYHYNSGSRDYVLLNEGEKIEEWFEVMKKHAPEIYSSIMYSIGDLSINQIKGNWSIADFSGGALVMVTYGEPDSASRNLLRRSANVFEQAYVRFLDLQKAEAQAREAQIEASLERVRARTMAMRGSEELLDVASILFQQVKALGVPQWNCGFNIWDIGDQEFTYYPGTPDGIISQSPCKIPLTEHPVFKSFDESRKRGDELFIYEKEGETQRGHYQYMLSLPGVGDLLQSMLDAGFEFPTFQIDHVANFAYGNLIFITYQHFPEMHEVFKRFAKVFEQTYTRFLDLQKAEAQAREAQIETALERVRSRTMAMQKSDELPQAATLLFQQIQSLGMPAWSAGYCTWNDDEKRAVTLWMSSEGVLQPPFSAATTEDELFIEMRKGSEQGKTLHVVEMGGAKLVKHYQYMRTLPVVGKILDSIIEAGHPLPTLQIMHQAYFSKGFLLFITYEPVPASHEIFLRFANVFDQTYTRFLDLQKAEDQARESQIQLAMERVRARTMAMQHSSELSETSALLFQQIQSLGVPPWSCGFNIWDQGDTVFTSNMGSPDGAILDGFKIPLTEEATFIHFQESRDRGDKLFIDALEGETLEEHYRYFFTLPGIKEAFEKRAQVGEQHPVFQINHLANFSHGNLMFITYEPCPQAHDIFIRFAKVFEQTYTRFLDLQKAEAQAREAQIANSLEKVRSRSLAMQSPDELIEVARLLREEMGALGVEELETSSIYIQEDHSGSTQCWFTIKNPDNPEKAITDQMTLNLQDTWVGRKMDEFVRSKATQTSILMQGEQRIEWIRYCEEKTELFGTSNFYGETIPDRTYHLYKFSNGYIGAAAPGEISTESWELLKRATAVFSFAYTRFRDLQMAQSSARAAMRQASLDRIRADISSMRNADDLGRITPLVFNELTTLGIPFIRCGVFIVHENKNNVEIYLSTPEGKSLAVMTLPFSANEMTSKSVEAWKKGEVYVQHWNQTDFINWGKSMQEQGYVKDLKTYQGAEAAPESLHLHFVPFAQGLLYVGSTETLSEEQIDLVKALAKSFAIAYARYEDFVKLEHAKSAVESAMNELKATQSQLVQQEKLASLGQLTAGIAHEIKNPLNFVNNFSEVSIEMIEEVMEERSKSQDTRDETLVDEILEDIKSNLQKVHEHGTRANGIVTSMLQHSRGGSGKMEPSNLNGLIKEYVNLSFHGMRANKNPIDVDIALDLDPQITDVPIIKEDFTRVVINLCNNAFDAMREKILKTEDRRRKTEDGDSGNIKYDPKLKVITSLENGQVRISIKDNGPGIPDEIKDKILQPFFTTKKGTEGTGLGLSITNDIIKAHGGELEIETSINKGTTFIIKLSK